MPWVVSGAAAVVQVAGQSRYLRRGARLPEQSDPESVAHLARVGLVTEVADEKPKPKPAPRKAASA